MLNTAIVRTPGPELIHGLTTSDLGTVDHFKALQQHQKYIQALRTCNLEVNILDPDPNFPDAVFVEDTALCLKECAIITRPGAKSRRNEVSFIQTVLGLFYDEIELIKSPGTLDGGDVLMVGDHFYIGLSGRTNEQGAKQLVSLLKKYGKSASTVPLKKVLHLKTGVSYLGDQNILASGEFIHHEAFKEFNIIPVDDQEAYATNVISINETIVMPKGYPATKAKIKELGYKVKEVRMSEFQKVDGGVTCLSLRF